MDFSKFKIRASKASKLMTGSIGLTDSQTEKLAGYIARNRAFVNGELNDKGKPISALTQNMKDDLFYLFNKRNQLPDTFVSTLRKIYYEEKHQRRTQFTNKFVQKGIDQENESVAVYSQWLRKFKGENHYFILNEKRWENDFFTGTPDLTEKNNKKKFKIGFDIKSSWNLDTFPTILDSLEDTYVGQNQVYMNLTGAEKWKTVKVLVNGTEHHVQLEKQKWYYALKAPAVGDPTYDEYVQKCRDVELELIFDRERFEQYNPYYDFDIPKDEWYGMGYDIPLIDRVIEFDTEVDSDYIKELKYRVRYARNYLKKLDNAYTERNRELVKNLEVAA